MDQGYNIVVLSETQTDIDWDKLVTDGVQAVVIRLSHGITQDTQASNFIAKAKEKGMYIHGYHDYEAIDGEVTFSLENAETLGLTSGAFMFLNSPPDDVLGFTNNWLSAGWNAGVKGESDDYYQWVVSDTEPDKGDLWQMDDIHGLDKTGDLVTEPKSNNPVVDPTNPNQPKEGAFVGYGIDSTGLRGGNALGYSTNGTDFYSVITPFGIIFRDNDAERISKLMMNKLKLQSPNGTVFILSVNDDGELKAMKESDVT
ncbi:hypothetical protein HFC69_00420 [Pediococcus sp. EKM202D]|uniref:GH25 family lysozyme n=1 Tax=unclassified Pediococcus TaxID=554805 RepID=UPI00142DA926|nr:MULTISPECIES: GH25 family lysozyme [unclassified Pediococcus]KAF5440753.1 hypothetical protein HFC69_00420 [Pediococcus sp. EKM202D]KAF5441684.1 hypothetical protein HFC68_02460 [Pediococcus sp. EKM201D]